MTERKDRLMFRTIGNTWQITKLSWKVLQLDRELIFFPIMGTIGALIVGVIAAGVFAGTGTFDRLGGGEAEFNIVDLIITLAAYFGGLYMVIFCNAALIAAARERLEGGDPNVMSGIRAVRGMWLAILGWTIITGTVGLILQALQSMARDNSHGVMRIVAVILISLLQTAWAYLTFFVIPILVVERVGPITAIRHSGGLLRRTWGEQLTASFSFFIIYLIAVLIVAIPVVILVFIRAGGSDHRRCHPRRDRAGLGCGHGGHLQGGALRMDLGGQGQRVVRPTAPERRLHASQLVPSHARATRGRNRPAPASTADRRDGGFTRFAVMPGAERLLRGRSASEINAQIIGCAFTTVGPPWQVSRSPP